MNRVLEDIEVIKWTANNMHYETRGVSFYQLHLLADRVKDFGSDVDDLKEKYYLGQNMTTPPRDVDIVRRAIDKYEKIIENDDAANGDKFYLSALSSAFDLIIADVEAIKKDTTLYAGIHAILDDISSRALTYKFLVSSQYHNDAEV